MGKKSSKKPDGSDRAKCILTLFRENPGRRMTLRHIALATGGPSRERRRETVEILGILVSEGTVEFDGRRYRMGEEERRHYTGKADVAGGTYVRCDEFPEGVFIDPRRTKHALTGDRVEFVISRKAGRGRPPKGEITAIVERCDRCYAGVAEKMPNEIVVHPDSRRMPSDIRLSSRKYPDIATGDKVAVRVTEWREGDPMPTGELVETLGTEGDNDAEMHAILLEYDLPYKFAPEVERAAEAIASEITERDYAERRDMRDAPTFTIDPADAKDFDDALSIRPAGEGRWEVGVHIADVTHYVREGSVIDNEAVERGTSVYLVDRTVPMLPERLSNELCSLRPHEEKLCFSAIFIIGEDAEVESEWFGRTVIYSDRRFAYEEAQQVIETGRGDMAEEILTLHRLAQTMRRERFRRGAIAFDRREAKFSLDESGHPTGVCFKVQKEANQLIEEFMLLANRRVAAFCARKNGHERTMVFRVHDKPDEEKFERFRQFILRFGHVFKASKGIAVARELNKLMEEVRGKAEENVVSMLAIRSMAKAVYTTDNIGHYGLGLRYYTHFTSPIRRYPDMMVHRLLQRYIDGGRSADKERLEQLAVRSSEREVVAAEAERASIKYKMVEFMLDKVGMEFDGHISGMTDWGIFVELEDSLIEGAIALRDLPGDFFRFEEERYQVCGVRTGRTFTLGDKVRIRVRNADLRRKMLDFVLAGDGEDDAPCVIVREPRGRRGGKRRH